MRFLPKKDDYHTHLIEAPEDAVHRPVTLEFLPVPLQTVVARHEEGYIIQCPAEISPGLPPLRVCSPKQNSFVIVWSYVSLVKSLGKLRETKGGQRERFPYRAKTG